MTDCSYHTMLRRAAAALVLAVLALAGSAPALASVQINFAPGTTLSFSPAGAYSVARDKPVGTVLAVATTTASAAGFSGTCQIQESYTTASPETAPGSGIYSTGVAGIGVQLYAVNGGAKTPITGTGGVTLTQTLGNPGTLPGLEADLVVSGPVSTGTLGSMPAVTASFAITGAGNDASCTGPSPAAQTLVTSAGGGAVTALTCTVTNSAITVALPTVSAMSLNAAGKTAGATHFSIPLSCADAGVNVYVTMSDATDNANTTSLLTLSSGSSASNVQIQLLRSDNSAVLFGPDSALAGTTNQWLVGPSSSVTGIPLTAEYYATGAAGPGTVEAMATFTMSYQ